MSVQSVNQQMLQQDIQSNLDKTMLLLRSLKAGEISLDDISMTANGWSIIVAPAVIIEAPKIGEDIVIQIPAEAIEFTG